MYNYIYIYMYIYNHYPNLNNRGVAEWSHKEKPSGQGIFVGILGQEAQLLSVSEQFYSHYWCSLDITIQFVWPLLYSINYSFTFRQ